MGNFSSSFLFSVPSLSVRLLLLRMKVVSSTSSSFYLLLRLEARLLLRLVRGAAIEGGKVAIAEVALRRNNDRGRRVRLRVKGGGVGSQLQFRRLRGAVGESLLRANEAAIVRGTRLILGWGS